MPKFTKKPITITAVQITDATFDDPHPNPEYIPGLKYCPIERIVMIPTPEGVMTGNLGDWIITGIKGEHYPCKNDIFQATYAVAPEIQADEIEAGPVVLHKDLIQGETYVVDHSRKGRFIMRLLGQEEIWFHGIMVDGKARAMMSYNQKIKGDQVTVRASHCLFYRYQNGKGKES